MTYPYSGPPSGPQPQQPYGQPGMGGPPPHTHYPGVGGPPLADWGTRFLGFLVDAAVPAAAGAVMYILMIIVGTVGGAMAAGNASDAPPVGLLITFAVIIGVAFLGTLAFNIWNRAYRRGTTGQTLGQKVTKIKTVSEATGQPIGFGMAFLRELCHFVDSFILYIGYLFPLWDDKRQTLADKIVKTVVVHVNPMQAGPAMPPPGPVPGYPAQGQPYGYGQPNQPPYPR